MVSTNVRGAIGAAIALVMAPAAAAQTSAQLSPGETQLEVEAAGEVTYLPDAAFITMGVVSTGNTAREATDANARAMTAVIAAVKRAGVGDRYIRTQQIAVEPRFVRANPNDWQGQPTISGYVARNSVAVTVTKLGSAPEVIAAGFDAGANSVNGPNLGSLDASKGLAEARDIAIANALAEAEGYAKALGMRVVRITRVSERGTAARQLDFVTVSGSRSGAVPPPPAPPAPPPPVAGGEMRRSTTVWVSFVLAR